MLSAAVEKSDLVLEIGSGSGLLTRRLAGAAGRVVAVEIDPRLAELCREHTEGLGNITLLVRDALESKTTLAPDLVGAAQDGMEAPEIKRLKAVANLSYAAATSVIRAFLEGPLQPELMVFTVQKEVSDKLSARPGSKNYGPLAVIAQTHACIEELRVIGPAAFFPQPKVNSAIVRMTPTDELLRTVRNYETYSEVVRHLFLHRRKKVTGALALAERLAMPREKLSAALDRAGIPTDARADALSVRQIVGLANEIESELSQ